MFKQHESDSDTITQSSPKSYELIVTAMSKEARESLLNGSCGEFIRDILFETGADDAFFPGRSKRTIVFKNVNLTSAEEITRRTKEKEIIHFVIDTEEANI